MEIKKLTKAEEEVMMELWRLKKCNVSAIVDAFSEPKPAYNTISTIVRILENKGFVGHEKKGRGYVYYPLIDKEDYSKHCLSSLLDGYFQGSFNSMVSFFMRENDINLKELESVLKEIKKNRSRG